VGFTDKTGIRLEGLRMKVEVEINTLGECFSFLIQKRRTHMRAVAKEIGCSLATVSRICSGRNYSINWIIIGGQTKPTKYPKDSWIREIESACDRAGIPVFEKNNLYPKGYSHLLRQELPSKESEADR